MLGRGHQGGGVPNPDVFWKASQGEGYPGFTEKGGGSQGWEVGTLSTVQLFDLGLVGRRK